MDKKPGKKFNIVPGKPSDLDRFFEYLTNFGKHKREDFQEGGKNKIKEDKVNKYLKRTKRILKAEPERDFDKAYAKIVPWERNGDVYLEGLKSLAGYMYNFCKNEFKKTKAKEKTKKAIENTKKDIVEDIEFMPDELELIIEFLLKDHCSVKTEYGLKQYFAKTYQKLSKENMDNEKSDYDIISDCIYEVHEKSMKNIELDDKVHVNGLNSLKIEKEKDINREKQDNYAIYGEEVDHNNRISPDSLYEILRTFFIENELDKIEITSPKPKSTINKKTKTKSKKSDLEMTGDLFDNLK